VTTARARVGDDVVTIDDRMWGEEPETRPEPARLAFAAAHVVMRDDYAATTHALDRPGAPGEIAEAIDWEGTLAIRRRLASHGFGIAEAMDTAQRFMLGWPGAERLISQCASLGVPFVAGASTDHLDHVPDRDALVQGVAHQCDVIAEAGGVPVILPMGQLVAWGAGPDEYVRTYADIASRHDGPVILHWLGPMFLASLEGYFPGDSFERVMASDPERIRGAKLSMLDDALEIRLRRDMIARAQVMLTGDDFSFASLIEGRGAPTGLATIGPWSAPIGDFSHALLGILGAIAAPAGRALRDLARADLDSYRRIMAPCEALSRIIFEAPTTHYKAGIAFLSWLDGHQSNAMLVNREDRARSAEHLRRVAKAGAKAGVFENADAAAERLERWARAQRD